MNAKPPQRIFVGIKVAGEIAEACVKIQAELADSAAKGGVYLAMQASCV